MKLPPRVVIAAARSGAGKTTISTGLMAALADRGLKVSGHKVGPDYIDPSYHGRACGRPGRNLDPYLVGEDLIAPLFAHGADGADVAVIEGVMGLFDGLASDPGFASTAHVARLLDAPVILVLDASGVSHSVAALVHGFRTWDRSITIAGVIFSMVGSERHEQLLREAVAPTGVPVLGMLRRDPDLAVPSRHLGLVPVDERPQDVSGWIRTLRQSVAAQIDLDAVVAVARTAADATAQPWTPPVSPAPTVRPVVAVASGRAFTFGYREQVELLDAAGADVVHFDPVQDTHLPEGTSGLIIGGGFPEVYVDRLSDNHSLLEDVRQLRARGGPIVAECAGLLWLAGTLDGREMAGVVKTDAAMTPRLTLCYREASAVNDNPIMRAGEVVRAHEFHRTDADPRVGEHPAWVVGDSEVGWADSTLLASYLHLHWAGLPEAAARFVALAAAASETHDRP